MAGPYTPVVPPGCRSSETLTWGGYSVQEARTQFGTTKRRTGLRSRGMSTNLPARVGLSFLPKLRHGVAHW